MQVDRRPYAEALAELVDDDVLDALRPEQAVVDAERGPQTQEVDGEAALGREMIGPGDLGDAVPERRGGPRIDLRRAASRRARRRPGGLPRDLRFVEAHHGELQQHALCQARPEAGAVAELQRSVERDAAAGLGDADIAEARGGSEDSHLGGQQPFDAPRGGREEGQRVGGGQRRHAATLPARDGTAKRCRGITRAPLSGCAVFGERP